MLDVARNSLDDRLSELSAALRANQIERAVPKLCDTSELKSLTQTLDEIPVKEADWRRASVALILVAELWPDRSLAAHVLKWSQTIS